MDSSRAANEAPITPGRQSNNQQELKIGPNADNSLLLGTKSKGNAVVDMIGGLTNASHAGSQGHALNQGGGLK